MAGHKDSLFDKRWLFKYLTKINTCPEEEIEYWTDKTLAEIFHEKIKLKKPKKPQK